MRTKLAFIVVVAVAIGAVFFMRAPSDTYDYQGHRIPMEQMRVVDPHPGCDYTHYHAAEVDAVSATDGTVLMDVSDCGYGPVQ